MPRTTAVPAPGLLTRFRSLLAPTRPRAAGNAGVAASAPADVPVPYAVQATEPAADLALSGKALEVPGALLARVLEPALDARARGEAAVVFAVQSSAATRPEPAVLWLPAVLAARDAIGALAATPAGRGVDAVGEAHAALAWAAVRLAVRANLPADALDAIARARALGGLSAKGAVELRAGARAENPAVAAALSAAVAEALRGDAARPAAPSPA